MDRIPVELLTKIVQKLDRQELLALSTVNRLFRIIAQAELYKEIDLRIPSAHNISQNIRAFRFAQTLERRPEMASLCRTLRCWYRPHCTRGADKVAYSSMCPPLSQLQHFRNLRNLRLHGFILSAEIRSAIRSLPQLRCVEVMGCEIDSHELGTHGIVPPQTRLEMIVYNPVPLEGWDNALAGLRGLTLSTNYRTEPTLSSLMPQVHSLDTLNINCVKFDNNIVSFLESTPQLRRISIHGPVEDPLHPIFSLPKNAIPILQYFAGPSEYCSTFINGRPIKGVELTSITSNTLLALRTSSVAITTLQLGPKVFAADLPHIPHTLHFLNLITPMCEETLLEWATIALCNMQDLQVLECDDMQVNITMPTISVLAEKCPSLREIRVHKRKVRVRERWLKCDDGRWNCYMVV